MLEYRPGLTAGQALAQAEQGLQRPDLTADECQVLAHQLAAHPDHRGCVRAAEPVQRLARFLYQRAGDTRLIERTRGAALVVLAVVQGKAVPA